MSLAHRFYLCLLDGKSRSLGSMYLYLKEAIPPEIAVRSYLRATGNNKYKVSDLTLDEQIEYGAWRGIITIASRLENKGHITLTSPDLAPRKERQVQITDAGLNYLLNSKTRTGVMGGVVAELKRLLRNGSAKVEIHLDLQDTE